jgi:hypothetical protein
VADPYRSSTIVVAPAPRRWLRFFCWIVGHHWFITRPGPALMRQVNFIAASDAHCLRCGATVLEYDSFARPLQADIDAIMAASELHDQLAASVDLSVLVDDEEKTHRAKPDSVPPPPPMKPVRH